MTPANMYTQACHHCHARVHRNASFSSWRHTPHEPLSMPPCAHRGLWDVADGFEVDMHPVELKENVQGVRGLCVLEGSRGTSPMVSVPLTSCLVIPAPAFRIQDMPAPLQDLLQLGSSPSLDHVQGSQYLGLAAWLLWLARLPHSSPKPPLRNASAVLRDQLLLDTWHTYIHHILPSLNQISNLMALTSPPLQYKGAWLSERAWAEALHAQWLGPAPGLGLSHSLDDTVWALAMARSRAIFMPIPYSCRSVDLMVPIIDLVNHAPSAVRIKQQQQQQWQNQGSQQLEQSSVPSIMPKQKVQQVQPANCKVVWSHDAQRVLLLPLRELRAGDELLIDYGERTAEQSMCDYGFVIA